MKHFDWLSSFQLSAHTCISHNYDLIWKLIAPVVLKNWNNLFVLFNGSTFLLCLLGVRLHAHGIIINWIKAFHTDFKVLRKGLV